MREIVVRIHELEIEVEVMGGDGVRCVSLTEFLTQAPGTTVESVELKREYADVEVPVGVRVG